MSDNKKFTLNDMKKVKEGIANLDDFKQVERNKNPNIRKEIKGMLKEQQNFSDKSSKSYLIDAVKDDVSTFDITVFDKTLAFTKFFLAERGESHLHDSSWYYKIASQFKTEFLEFYEFFLENGSNVFDSTTYLEDFKAFFAGEHLKDVERFEKETAALGAKETNWYKGVMDAFNQEPNSDQFWENDEYYSGYQRGTDIFRGLMKEAKLLFPAKKPRNKFVEQQQKLASIINKFQTKTDSKLESTNDRFAEILENPVNSVEDLIKFLGKKDK